MGGTPIQKRVSSCGTTDGGEHLPTCHATANPPTSNLLMLRAEEEHMPEASKTSARGGASPTYARDLESTSCIPSLSPSLSPAWNCLFASSRASLSSSFSSLAWSVIASSLVETRVKLRTASSRSCASAPNCALSLATSQASMRTACSGSHARGLGACADQRRYSSQSAASKRDGRSSGARRAWPRASAN
eukprot:CAMPEP_0119393040 /NCGR_PEP_ID=MMETSP1334-20130426/123803_1 /TAXON_ID=127549 /ORGANISM="Calcidiscus leptoporus, Strain RCC1130" /LENGTH=189 /DNA_ID=CAMNT_0007416015 /DNA_START=111 /DNA_END=677 /DNA_ORIENTATION=+